MVWVGTCLITSHEHVFCPSHEHGSSPDHDQGGFPEYESRARLFAFFSGSKL